MNKRQVIGLILLIAAITCYFLQPFKSDMFDFFSGVIAAIGVGLLVGWIRKN